MATTPQVVAFTSASRASAEQHLLHLQPQFAHSRWLPPSNRYRDDCVGRIEADHNSHGVQQADLCYYISASALPHSLDGWSFFGRAIGALLRGDSVACRHLGYYAELRATMSLLATSGIGVFDGRHYVVRGLNTAAQIPRYERTHVLAWKALSHWVGTADCSTLLENLITPGGIPIEQWQQGMFSKASFALAGKTWLQYWGLDVQLCANDQHLRNLSSYRPSHLADLPSVGGERRVRFVKEFWRMCEPSGAELFQRLDRQLLRKWIRSQYVSVTGDPANSGCRHFVKEVKQLVDNVNPIGLSKSGWVEFLTMPRKHEESPILRLASRDSQNVPWEQHFEMLSRALMLLRLASGACRRLVINSGVAKEALVFWWHGFGAETSLWDAADCPADSQELWLDIQHAIQDFDTWLEGDEHTRMRTFRRNQSSGISVIDEAERVGLWGIGL